MITDRVLTLGIFAARLGHYLRNSLVAVQTFIDLAPEKLLEEKISAEQIRNPNFWKEFYEQAQIQIRRITELLTDLVSASEISGTPKAPRIGPETNRAEVCNDLMAVRCNMASLS